MSSVTRVNDNPQADQSPLTMDNDASRGITEEGTAFTLPVLYLPPGAVTQAAWLMARQLQHALTVQTADYWARRSEDFRAVGTEECDMIADNCANHARLVRGEFDYWDEIADYWTCETQTAFEVAA